ncbi:heavy-metal-associated domain-containing protein [Halovenus rubra]|uniref:Heavy-metal-associated domain-containing protein n=2 Tax=Halovenus rubra TaxID=869890 RepID=A0ABD5X7M2_9EURY|nr:heavy-metal-associated domain-containing protein [Halovenus rubra]
MGQQTYTVTGMSCGGCEENVENSVREINSVSHVDADHENNSVEVIGDGVSDTDVVTAIKDAGYEIDA